MLWDPMDIAWVAGIIEGEGSIVCPTTPSTKVVVTVRMTDVDVIQHLFDVTGIGRVNGPYQPKGKNYYKPYWQWVVTQTADCSRLLLAVYPLLHSRRQAKVAEAVDRISLSIHSTIGRNLQGMERPIRHGTMYGYTLEGRRGLPRCVPCTEANRLKCQKDRARVRSLKQAAAHG